MPIAFFTRTQTGALVSRLNNDIIGAQQAFTNTLGSVVSNVITVTIVIVAMLALSWQITLASLALLPLFVIPARLVGKKLQAITRERYMVSAEMNNTMTERFNVSGALLVKLFGTPALEQPGFEDKAARVRDLGITSSIYNGFFYSSMFLLTSLATALVYGWGGVLSVDGVLDIGTVVALTAYLQRLYGPLNQLSSVQIDVMTALVSFDRVFEVLDLEPMIDDKPGAIDLPPGPARIEFDHVDFRYPRADEVSLASLESVAVLDQTPNHQVLSDVSFSVEPGELVALVGHSGAGKTTISNLVPRLYDVQSGAIRINGVDVRDATLASIRETIGVVTQDAHLFHDTIRANLEFARPEATEAEMREALAAAQILPLIDALPDGLDTVVGDRGYRFSGGEKQRIAIARLLLKAPQIVVLDEATAHLDSESEVAVQAALETALAGSNVDRDRAPPVDRPPRRQDPRGVGGRASSSRHPRRAPRARRRLRRPLRDAVQTTGHAGGTERYAVSSGTRHGVMPCSRAIRVSVDRARLPCSHTRLRCSCPSGGPGASRRARRVLGRPTRSTP